MASGAQSPVRERPIQFGKYALLARIGGGGMGELFLAQLRSAGGFEKLVVIKRILSHLTDKPEFVDMFVAEARTAARISHPNVCQIYELGQVDGRYYMAIEYLEGLPLAEVMVARKRRPQLADLRLLASLVGQTAEGLHHAHSLRDPDGESAHVVHRDVNPRNVFVTSAGVAKVLDFGIVKVRGALSQIQTDSVRGTYSYMAPEQLQGESVDCTADIFSLGTITWEAVVGRRLFKRGSDLLTWRAIVEEPIPRPSQFRADLAPELDDAIMRALARAPSERFQSAREFAAAVEQAIHPLGAPLTTLAIAEEMEKAFTTELAAQRERVFAAHRRQEADRLAAEPIDDWDVGGSDTRVADPGYAELVQKMAYARSQQLAVPAEPLADVSSEGLELSEPTAPAAKPSLLHPVIAAGAAPAATLPPPSRLPSPPPLPSYMADDGYPADISVAAGTSTQPAVDDGDEDEQLMTPVRRRRRVAFAVLALAVSAASGAAVVLFFNRSSSTDPADAVPESSTPQASKLAAAPPEVVSPSPEPSVPAASAAGVVASPAPAPNRPISPPAASRPVVPPRAPEKPVEKVVAGPAEPGPVSAGQAQDAPPGGQGARDANIRRPPRIAAATQPVNLDRDGGFLTINAEPYATLYVDGKKHGYTPIVRLALPPGPHRLRLVSSNGQPEKKMRVRIVPGQELRKFVKW